MTETKDHYATLELPPSADAGMVKKAYRRLAQEFHPDKTNNDPYANARFRAIKEAYEILSDPRKKEQYLQQRWYQQSTGRKMASGEAITPPLLLQQCLSLFRYVRTLDYHRMDRQGLTERIEAILNDDDLRSLAAFQEPDTLNEAFQVLMRCITPLHAAQLEMLQPRMLKLTGNDPVARQQTDLLIRSHRSRESREKWMPWIVLLAAITAIVLIFLLAR